MHDIFISYSTQDKAFATPLMARIEQRGLSCWIAPRNVKYGHDYKSSIVEAIEASRVVLLLISRHANESLEIPKEMAVAKDAGKLIIPARIENVKPARALAYDFTTAQFLDLFDDFEANFDRLCIDLEESLKATTGTEPRLPAAASKAYPAEAVIFPEKPIPAKRTGLILTAAVTAVIVIGLGVWLLLTQITHHQRNSFVTHHHLNAPPAASAAPGSVPQVPAVSPDRNKHLAPLSGNTASLGQPNTANQPNTVAPVSKPAAPVPNTATGGNTMTPNLLNAAAARKFITDYYGKMSGPPDAALSFLDAVLENPLTFYGKTETKPALLRTEAAYFRRWPDRRFSASPDSFAIHCDDTNCEVTGTVNYDVGSASRNARSSGSERFHIQLRQSGNSLKVAAVTSTPVVRRSAPLTAVSNTVNQPVLAVTTRDTVLRRTPDPYGDHVESIEHGTTVTVVKQDADGWAKVRAPDGQAGYLYKSNLGG